MAIQKFILDFHFSFELSSEIIKLSINDFNTVAFCTQIHQIINLLDITGRHEIALKT